MKNLRKAVGASLFAFALTAQVAAAKVFPDPARDVKIPALDIRKVDVNVVGGEVSFKVILAGRTHGNASYAAYASCGKKLWQLSADRAAGETAFSLFNWGTNKNEDLPGGSIDGRTVILAAPADQLGCTKANLRFFVSTEDDPRNGGKLPVKKSTKTPSFRRLQKNGLRANPQRSDKQERRTSVTCGSGTPRQRCGCQAASPRRFPSH